MRGGGPAPADELRELRPPVDLLRMASARERAESALFGAASAASLGRYVLLGSTADGGMGVVYDAYDPQLERKVALKVLHPQRRSDDHAHERLTNEARSLAKLDHPNVVKVHDVVTQDAQDAQVVIVMEWVDGVTLADWQRAWPRSWADVVGVYVQAGQGLAAAHGLGVVHRDFKPSNAIVGNDGRVRVLDFGLARSAASLARSAGAEPPPGEAAVAPPRPDPEAPTASLTATGALVGTLAYAAPEQLAGQPATLASDQFSFAVSLHRALEGVPPFAGDDAVALAASIRSGRIALASDARAVPKWLRAVVARALAERPEARFPSMSALLFELTRARGWRRWQIPLLVGACLAIAVLALVLRPDPLAECDGGVAEVARVWNALESWRVQAALKVVGATPDALRIRDRVRGGIDEYRDHWIDGHRRACVASRKGEQSADLLDRRMRCLDRRLGDLKATVDVVARLDAASAGNAMDIVARMPQLAECVDVESLQAETAPPSDAQRVAVDAVRARISQAMALDRAGRSGEAASAGRAADADARRIGYRPLIAEAALALGRIYLERNWLRWARGMLHSARQIALEHHMFAVAVEAAAREVYVEGKRAGQLDGVQRDADTFLALARSLPSDRFAGPLLLNSIGTAYMAAGQRTEATSYFRQARAALKGQSPALELIFIDKNLALVTANDREREALAIGVWQRLRDELGESHLETLDALVSYGRYVAEPSRARSLVAEACDGYDLHHRDLTEQRITCRSSRAFLAGELGDHAEELRVYDEIIEIAADRRDEYVATPVTLARGYARLLRGDGDGAVAALQPIAARDATRAQWWARVPIAHAELGIGLADHLLGRDGDAADHLARALALYDRIIPVNEEVEYGRRREIAMRALADLR